MGRTCRWEGKITTNYPLDVFHPLYAGTKWGRMLDTLPLSQVQELPCGRRAPIRLGPPLVTVSGDTTMHHWVMSKRDHAIVPANTPRVQDTGGYTVRDIKDFAVAYLRAWGTYRLHKGKGESRNICGDFAVAAYIWFTSCDHTAAARDAFGDDDTHMKRQKRIKPFMATRSHMFSCLAGPVALGLSHLNMNTDWYLRRQGGRRLSSARLMILKEKLPDLPASVAATVIEASRRFLVGLDLRRKRATLASNPKDGWTQETAA